MLLNSLQLTARNLRGIARVISNEPCLKVQSQKYGRWVSRKYAAIENEDELFDVYENTSPTSVLKKKVKAKSRTSPTLETLKKVKSVKFKAEEVQKENEEIYKDSFENDNVYKNKRANTSIKSVKSKAKEVEKENDICEDSFENDNENVNKIKTANAGIKSVKSKSKEVEEENDEISEDSFENDTRNANKKETMTINTKLHNNEKIVSSILMKLKSKKQRKKQDKILMEGKLLIKEAIEVGLNPEVLIFSRFEDVKDLNYSKEKTELYKITYRTIQLWSTLTTSPGIMAIFPKPKPQQISKKKSLPITIVCDNIRDPGNMGSILRAGAGLGCEKILLTKGCVDFWDPKVLRSATGAQFRVPIFGSQDWEDIRGLINAEANVYVADNNIDCNQEYAEEISEETSVENEEENEKPASKQFERNGKRYSFNPFIQLNNLPVIPYYSVDYTKNEVVLIVGGETHGLSEDSFKLINERQGIRVNIPLNNGIESLNAGMALGIVAFEIKRQFLLIQNKLNELQ